MHRGILARGRGLALAVLSFAAAGAALAQGGPPLETDDPGTPGDGNWEVNVALTVEAFEAETTFEAPLIDANYGVGDRLQLKVELPFVIHEEEDEPALAGLGNTLLGVKWRFLDQEDGGVDFSVYPQFEFNNPTASEDRGFVDDGWTVLLPAQASRRFGRFSLNADFGAAIHEIGGTEWWCGLAAGFEATERLEILAEVRAETGEGFSDGHWIAQGGARYWVSDSVTLLFAAGRGLGDERDEDPEFLGYLGLQILR